jgi:hypothetical protein
MPWRSCCPTRWRCCAGQGTISSGTPWRSRRLFKGSGPNANPLQRAATSCAQQGSTPEAAASNEMQMALSVTAIEPVLEEEDPNTHPCKRRKECGTRKVQYGSNGKSTSTSITAVISFGVMHQAVAARQLVLRCRERINSSKSVERFVIGLTFMGFVFSVATSHWWLEHKVGIYAWVLLVLGTFVLSLLAPDRNVTFALFVFGGSYVSFGRSWQWFHGELPAYVPLLWIFGIALVLSIAPKWKLALSAALGMWALLSVKAALLDREPRALIIAAIALALIIGILVTARRSDS